MGLGWEPRACFFKKEDWRNNVDGFLSKMFYNCGNIGERLFPRLSHRCDLAVKSYMLKSPNLCTVHAMKKPAATSQCHVVPKDTVLLSCSPVGEDCLSFVNQFSWDFSIGNGGLLPRKWNRLRSTCRQPQRWRPLYHLHLLSEQKLGFQGTLE